jgi:transposase InsO family protein
MRLATVSSEEGADAGGLVSDVREPGRLPRRNHYQEGPGFLFVATQGGRPPEDAARWGEATVVRRRRAALRRWADGEPAATICAELSCGRASLFRWRARFQAEGLDGLLDRPRVGRASELPPALERLILTVRLLTYWNSRRIAAEFRRRGVWPLSHGQVDRLLARHGTHRPSYVRVPGPRYERAAVNELWHIDLKGPFYLLGATGRARTATSSPWSTTTAGSCWASARCQPRRRSGSWACSKRRSSCAASHELMSDNGTPFVAITRPMLSRFQRSLEELRIRHIRTQIDTPWTNGKIEAFWASLQREVLDRQQLADLAAAEAAVTAYAGYYNYHRLHGELDWQTPAERFDGTPFTDRGFGSVPALAGVADLLDALLVA